MTTADTQKSPADRWPTTDEDELLPASFDELVSIECLTHGANNPRRVEPSAALRRSVDSEGLERPLVVHRPDGTELFHITDGWQRYQAAIDAGWEQLPVRICETAVEAIQTAERESLGREYSTYEWARLCQGLAANVDGSSTHEVAETVANKLDNARSAQTVKRYLRVLSLPREIHPLLVDGPDGTESDWRVLKRHDAEIKRYDGLSWVVAHEIAKHRNELSESRAIELAVRAIDFDRATARKFIELAAERPSRPLEGIEQQVRFDGQSDRRLVIPRVVVQLSPEQKRAVMEYTHRTRTQLTQLVEERIRTLANNHGDKNDV